MNIFPFIINISCFAEIPDGTKKVCSACLTRLTRKITQLTGTSENHKPTGEERLGTEVLLWREDEIETLKGCLRNNGKNWSLMSESLNKSKSPEQCKKFFYGQRKKYQLDKLVLEYKRVSPTNHLNIISIAYYFNQNGSQYSLIVVQCLYFYSGKSKRGSSAKSLNGRRVWLLNVVM